jgi:hypothetical protein
MRRVGLVRTDVLEETCLLHLQGRNIREREIVSPLLTDTFFRNVGSYKTHTRRHIQEDGIFPRRKRFLYRFYLWVLHPVAHLSNLVSYDAVNRNKVSIRQLSLLFLPAHYMFRPLQAIFR